MKIYGLSGLGADQRVFKYLSFQHDFIPINWLKPKNKESIDQYASRLSATIDRREQFALLGVSFGGLVAIEISKRLQPCVTILISSVETRADLPSIIKIIGRVGLVRSIPACFFSPPRKLMHYLFGAIDKKLLNDILDDTDPHFVKWALSELVIWENNKRIDKVIKISGSDDKLMPPTKSSNEILIDGGGHFMVVDRADEVSASINRILKAYPKS